MAGAERARPCWAMWQFVRCLMTSCAVAGRVFTHVSRQHGSEGHITDNEHLQLHFCLGRWKRTSDPTYLRLLAPECRQLVKRAAKRLEKALAAIRVTSEHEAYMLKDSESQSRRPEHRRKEAAPTVSSQSLPSGRHPKNRGRVVVEELRKERDSVRAEVAVPTMLNFK